MGLKQVDFLREGCKKDMIASIKDKVGNVTINQQEVADIFADFNGTLSSEPAMCSRRP